MRCDSYGTAISADHRVLIMRVARDLLTTRAWVRCDECDCLHRMDDDSEVVCLLCAVVGASDGPDRYHVADHVLDALRACLPSRELTTWHDAPERRLDDVLALIDTAIERELGPEQKAEEDR